MTEIETILTRLSVSVDEDPKHCWEIVTNSAITRVTAGTAETFANPEDAFRAALELRRALLGTGARERYTCVVGATTENAGEEGWRGTVDLGFAVD